ncbi:MAG: hypothetical protein JNM39_17585 [Bdellovibrionaceae bacterium]|nr:hypothetical protein [Pseudobdellovibrionaceae bacterium]
MGKDLLRMFSLWSLFVLLAGCCPPGGVDRSRTSENFILAVDFYQQNQPVEITNHSTEDLRIQVVDRTGYAEYGFSLSFDVSNSNRAIFELRPYWTEENIVEVNLLIGGIALNQIDFLSLNKQIYQKPSTEMVGYARNTFKTRYHEVASQIGDQIVCALSSIKEVILPSAQAMSCSTKKGSLLSFRPGVLVRIDLGPAQ